jgi:hypothetical protein
MVIPGMIKEIRGAVDLPLIADVTLQNHGVGPDPEGRGAGKGIWAGIDESPTETKEKAMEMTSGTKAREDCGDRLGIEAEGI